MNLLNIFTLVTLITCVAVSSAQKRPKRVNSPPKFSSGVQSPFRKPGAPGGKAVQSKPVPNAPRYPPPKKSPFTPPPKSDKSLDESKTNTEGPVVKSAPQNNNGAKTKQAVKQSDGKSSNRKDNLKVQVQVQRDVPKERTSPFKPPVPGLWRKGTSGQGRESVPNRTSRKLNKIENSRSSSKKIAESTLEKSPSQKPSLRGIPSISSIEIKPRKTAVSHNVAGRRRLRPMASPYQDILGHRDMHDVGPGVTPWTRYTVRPRGAEQGSRESRSNNARCGVQRYSPRKQMCCQGHLVRRQGVKPSCCGNLGYDRVYNKCCNGIVSFRSEGQPDC